MDIDPDEPVLFQEEAAKAGARGVQSKEYLGACAICGTGMGVSIICNNFRVFMQHYAKAFIRPEGQKLSITPMYSVWVDLYIVAMRWGREMARTWLEAEHMVGLDPEMARIVEKEFDELVEFENEMYRDTRQ